MGRRQRGLVSLTFWFVFVGGFVATGFYVPRETHQAERGGGTPPSTLGREPLAGRGVRVEGSCEYRLGRGAWHRCPNRHAAIRWVDGQRVMSTVGGGSP